MIRITKACILKSRIVDCSCLIKQIKCNFCSTDWLLFWVYQVLHAQNIGLVKIHHCDIVETAENIVMDFVFHKGDSWVKRVMPCEMQIIHNGSKVLVPVQMFCKYQSILGIHLDCRNELVEDIESRVIGKLKWAYFISELINLIEVVPEWHRDLGRFRHF